MFQSYSLRSFFIICGSFMVLFSCSETVQEKEIIRPVRYMHAYSTGGSRVRTFNGVAQAGMESQLSFKVPGTVQKVAVLVGDNVKRGQLLAQLDAKDYQLQVQQMEAAISQAQAQARNASANYDRVRALYELNNASRADLDGARTTYESAEAGQKAAEKQLEMAKLQLSYTRLLSPVDGAIASVSVEVNENVNAGQPIAMLTSGNELEVRLSIPEVLIAQITEGDNVDVTFDAIPNRSFSGKVLEVGVATTGMGTTFPVTVRLNKSDSEIRPGMAANVAFNFKSSDARERFYIPSQAVLEDRQGRFVFTVIPIPDEDGYGTIERKEVKVGELTASGIEIFEGLDDGDLVVTAGVSSIHKGLKVKI
ncbi:efflux RND transporter periplasmic adaptor subunit [candidate division KSB1 bacterium]|nr:efflux RND transporter periplasmic adaptor subunit [candidate division KSB1 bacterium]